jgi:hypothetical protein
MGQTWLLACLPTGRPNGRVGTSHRGLARLAVIFGEEFPVVLVLAASEVTLTGASIDTADGKG